MIHSPPSIAAMWDEAERVSGVDRLSPDLRKHLRRMFYAGAMGILTEMVAVGQSHSEADGAVVFEMWQVECLVFLSNLKEGKA